MEEPLQRIVALVERDQRYKVDAYILVQNALAFAQSQLKREETSTKEKSSRPHGPRGEAHLTGQELCESIRAYAIEQFGFMAKVVLNSWGLHCTGDFGEIVYNMIEIELLKKSDRDRREDFDDVFDFDEAFQRQFQITMTD